MNKTPSRIVVTGASGNVGAGVLRTLARQLPDAEVVGVCRRPPAAGGVYDRVRWHAVDLSQPDAAAQLAPAMRGAYVVIHLALAVQPVRDEDYLYQANVAGTQSVLTAMNTAGIRHLIYASSLGIYAPGATTRVSESWPDIGQSTSIYSRHKVIVERLLDQFELDHPEVVVARFRPTVVVQREAAWLIRTLYLGPFVPQSALKLLRRRLLPRLPLPEELSLQFVHADDVGDAVFRLLERRAQGSFNIAADVLDSPAIANLVGARPVAVDRRVARTVVSVLSSLRLVALTPGWYDIATNSPLMDTSKARNELGWAPTRTSSECASELIDGLADDAVGLSAATGLHENRHHTFRHATQQVHDATLALWFAAAFARAVGIGRPGAADAVVIAVNLASGTPAAFDRLRAHRRDAAALLAPLAVAAAVLASTRGGWTPVAATAVLQMLNTHEHKRLGDQR